MGKLVHALLIIGTLTAQSALAAVVEQLDYRAIYKGAFSFGRSLPIADVQFETRDPGGSSSLQETRVTASSENYEHVESFYPMRYRFRTWASAADGRVVGFENYEQTKRTRHRLYLRDDEGTDFRRYDLGDGAGTDVVASLEAGINPAAPPRDEFIDRLGLLQKIRGHRLAVDEQFSFAVTRGKENLSYDVRVEAIEEIVVQETPVEAWKVRLDGFEWDDEGRLQPAHRPVYIWFSRDARHVPLRIESHHAIGTFLVELNTPPAIALNRGLN
ncbi:MAG: DUF3108 domain-containing protein [Gammaproteobacteria bacterium]|nr:DUF3108 domain-containing protein [Gammaproteobacteria bacterium]